MSISSNQSRGYKKKNFTLERVNVANFYNEVTYNSFSYDGTPVTGLRVEKKKRVRLALNFDLVSSSNTVFQNATDRLSTCFLTLGVKNVSPGFDGGTFTLGLVDTDISDVSTVTWRQNSTLVEEIVSQPHNRLYRGQLLSFDVTNLIRKARDLQFSNATIVIRFTSENFSSNDFVEFENTQLPRTKVPGKFETTTRRTIKDFTATLKKEGGVYSLIPTTKTDEVSSVFLSSLDGTGISLDIEPFTYQRTTITPTQSVTKDTSLGLYGISGGISGLEDGDYQVTVNSMTTNVKDPSLVLGSNFKPPAKGLFYIDYEGASGANYGTSFYRYSTQKEDTNTRYFFPDDISISDESKYDPGAQYYIRDASKCPRLTVFKRVKN